MKKLLLMFFTVSLTTMVFAQQGSRIKGAENRLEKLTQELDLSTDQQVKIKAILKNKPSRETMKSMTKEERKAERKAIEQKINAVLTPAQVKKKNQLKAERKANHPKGQGKGVGKWTKQLDLSIEQQAQLKEILANKPNREAIKNMTPAERKAERAAFNEKFDAILTPAQLEKKNEFKAKRKAEMKADRDIRAKRKAASRADRQAALSEAELMQRAENRTEKLNKQVGLSDEQAEKVLSLNKDFMLKSQEISINQQLNIDERKAAFRELDKEHRETIKAILTPAQLQKVKAIRKNKRGGKNKK